MDERMFGIYEWDGISKGGHLITKSELKRRLAHIAPMDLRFSDGTECVDDRDIYYLIHGEEMKE